MSRPISQTITFKDVSAEYLFDIYMDSEKHSAAVKSKASISKDVGGKFWVFGEHGLTGNNLYIFPTRMVVQTWRSNLFSQSDLDSILTLTFSDSNQGAQIDLFHVNVPESLYDNTRSAWKKYYWSPWKEYVKERRPKKPLQRMPHTAHRR